MATGLTQFSDCDCVQAENWVSPFSVELGVHTAYICVCNFISNYGGVPIWIGNHIQKIQFGHRNIILFCQLSFINIPERSHAIYIFIHICPNSHLYETGFLRSKRKHIINNPATSCNMNPQYLAYQALTTTPPSLFWYRQKRTNISCVHSTGHMQ